MFKFNKKNMPSYLVGGLVMAFAIKLFYDKKKNSQKTVEQVLPTDVNPVETIGYYPDSHISTDVRDENIEIQNEFSSPVKIQTIGY